MVSASPYTPVGGDLIMAFHREFSTHCRPSQSLELVAALEKVWNDVVLSVVRGSLAHGQCCEVQSDILTEFEKQTRYMCI